jgi:hypothetical protein
MDAAQELNEGSALNGPDEKRLWERYRSWISHPSYERGIDAQFLKACCGLY